MKDRVGTDITVGAIVEYDVYGPGPGKPHQKPEGTLTCFVARDDVEVYLDPRCDPSHKEVCVAAGPDYSLSEWAEIKWALIVGDPDDVLVVGDPMFKQRDDDSSQRNLAPLGRAEIEKTISSQLKGATLTDFWPLPHKEGQYPSAIVMWVVPSTRGMEFGTHMAYRNGYGLDDLVMYEDGHYGIDSRRDAMMDARRRVEMHGGSFSREEKVSY